jgi:MFS family permease
MSFIEKVTMSRKQLSALFICYLVPLIAANALLPLLPLHIRALGGGSGTAGLSLAISFGATSAGMLMSGWLSNRFSRRREFIIGAFASSIGIFALMALTDSIVLLTALTAASWFLAGMQLAMVQLLTGMFAEKKARGRAFGIIGMTSALSQLIAGATAGSLVEHWNFAVLFLTLAVVHLALLPAALMLEDRTTPRVTSANGTPPLSNGTFRLIFYSALLIWTANFITNMGKPLAMTALDFSPSAVASTIAVAGLINLPLPVVIGWLSDRMGRRAMMLVCYAAGIVGVVIYLFATSLWHFWLAQVCLTLTITSVSIGAALVTDLVPARSLNSSLTLYSASSALGGMIGYAVSGAAFQHLGLALTFELTLVLPILALVIMLALQPARLAIRSTAEMVSAAK